MDRVRSKERQAELLAHLLDDMVPIRGTLLKFGLDPLIGLIPVFGDVLVTAWGAVLLAIARQLDVPWSVVGRMAYNLLKNGVVGSIPFVGDAYSMYYRSNALNTALLLRAVKCGKEGSCTLTTRSLTMDDVTGLVLLIAPVLLLTVFVSLWFWDHGISYYSLLFPMPYTSRGRLS